MVLYPFGPFGRRGPIGLQEAALNKITLGVGRGVLRDGQCGQAGCHGVGLVRQDGAGPGGEGFQGQVDACVLLKLGRKKVQGLPVSVSGALSFQGWQD